MIVIGMNGALGSERSSSNQLEKEEMRWRSMLLLKKYMEYKMSNCIIGSVTTSGGEEEFPQEDVTIDFGKMEWAYTVQKRQGGGAAGNVAGGWDLQRNCKV